MVGGGLGQPAERLQSEAEVAVRDELAGNVRHRQVLIVVVDGLLQLCKK